MNEYLLPNDLVFRPRNCTFAPKYVQTDIQQAPGARVPAVREQGLFAVQLSGQGGSLQRALRGDADIRLCRKCQHGSCGDRLDCNDNGSRDDARGG